MRKDETICRRRLEGDTTASRGIISTQNRSARLFHEQNTTTRRDIQISGARARGRPLTTYLCTVQAFHARIPILAGALGLQHDAVAATPLKYIIARSRRRRPDEGRLPRVALPRHSHACARACGCGCAGTRGRQS